MGVILVITLICWQVEEPLGVVETDDKELTNLALLTRYESLKFGVFLILDRLILFILSNLLPHLLSLLNANLIEYP